MATGIPRKWKTDRFKRETPAPLKFGADGKFKILHITDIHCVQPVMDDDEIREIPDNKHKETINVIEQLVAKTNPDLVVFGGDNVSGSPNWTTMASTGQQECFARHSFPSSKHKMRKTPWASRQTEEPNRLSIRS